MGQDRTDGRRPPVVQSYRPNPKQQRFHASAAKFRLLLGAWGAAKTTMLAQEDIQLALEFPGSLGVVFRKTYPSLRDTTQRQYLDSCPRELIQSYRRSEGREEIVFPNGSITQFRCLDDPLKLGSTQYDRVNIDEAGEVDEYAFRTLAFGRLRGPIGPRRMVVASNPVDRTHWLYRFFVTEATPDIQVFHYATYDNTRTCTGWILPDALHLAADEDTPGAEQCPKGPAGSHEHLNVPTDYVARLRAMTDQEQKKFLHGEWGVIAAGKPVFPMFSEKLHVADLRVIRNQPVFRGWDPGFASPACGWWQQDATGGWVKLHELVAQHEPADRFIQRVLDESGKWFPTNSFLDFCDVAGSYTHDTGPAFTQVGRKRFGIAFQYRKLLLARSLMKMQHLFSSLGMDGVPLARIDRRCELSIAAYAGNYYVDPRDPDGMPKKPNHPYDDIVDADRYALAPSLMAPAESPTERQRSAFWRVA